MAELNGSQTHANLLEAFTIESRANRRYLWFAQQADVEGFPRAAALFRSIAEGETGHAHGHLEYLAEIGDPVAAGTAGGTEERLRAVVAEETHDGTEMYPEFARVAREEGFDEIAEWFETLARAEQVHAERFRQGLESL